MAVTAPLGCLGDISVEQFIADYWHKKPLLIRNALKNFTPLLSADELAGMACEAEVESRYIGCDQDGNWTLKSGPFDDEFFASLPASDWTLLVQAVDHWLPEASDFLQQFRFIPSWRLDDLMISYACKGGGVGPHYDNYDVFLLQAEGQRRWEIGGLYGEQSPIEPDKPVRILSDWQAEQSWVLEPGDMLYLPPCVGHNGVAESDGCITYSIGYRAPQTGDMLLDFANAMADSLNQEDRYADPDLSLRVSSGEITQSDLLRVQSLFRRFVDDKDRLALWFGELMTQAKYPEQALPSSDEEPALLLDAVPGLRLTEGVRCAYWKGRDHLHLFVDGRSWQLPTELIELVCFLADQRDYPTEKLRVFCQNSKAEQLLHELLQLGILYPLEEID